MTRLIGYARVSTADQSLALQLDALKAAGAAEIMTDKASGARLDRAGLRKALDAMEPGDTLAVWKLDRLGRSLRQLIDTVEEIQAKGCHFQSLTDAIDTKTASGRLLYSVIGAIAEFERETIRERVRAGLGSAKAAGRTLGRPATLTAEDADTARHLLDQGHSWASVARVLKTSKTSLWRAFQRFPATCEKDSSDAARPFPEALVNGQAQDEPAVPFVLVRRRDRGPEGAA